MDLLSLFFNSSADAGAVGGVLMLASLRLGRAVIEPVAAP
jgi:hypothetical protein